MRYDLGQRGKTLKQVRKQKKRKIVTFIVLLLQRCFWVPTALAKRVVDWGHSKIAVMNPITVLSTPSLGCIAELVSCNDITLQWTYCCHIKKVYYLRAGCLCSVKWIADVYLEVVVLTIHCSAASEVLVLNSFRLAVCRDLLREGFLLNRIVSTQSFRE